eukprot:3645590-Prymnesium_polylepis.1
MSHPTLGLARGVVPILEARPRGHRIPPCTSLDVECVVEHHAPPAPAECLGTPTADPLGPGPVLIPHTIARCRILLCPGRRTSSRPVSLA